MRADAAMQLTDGVAALRRVRRDGDVVVTTMSVASEWMASGSHPLDFVFVPSCMGHATSLGLGLALACPDRRIIVCNGDGSMLMNLGSLVSITAAAPPNLVVIVFDNGGYEVTGGQPTPGAPAARQNGGRVDFAAVARACGFLSVFNYSAADCWTVEARAVLEAIGPTFVVLDVELEPGRPGPRSPGPAKERARTFMQALGRGKATATPNV